MDVMEPSNVVQLARPLIFYLGKKGRAHYRHKISHTNRFIPIEPRNFNSILSRCILCMCEISDLRTCLVYISDNLSSWCL